MKGGRGNRAVAHSGRRVQTRRVQEGYQGGPRAWVRVDAITKEGIAIVDVHSTPPVDRVTSRDACSASTTMSTTVHVSVSPSQGLSRVVSLFFFSIFMHRQVLDCPTFLVSELLPFILSGRLGPCVPE